MAARKYKCPSCGSWAAVRIVYGLPTPETWDLSEAGEIALGGCCQEIGAPDRRCKKCRFEWNSRNHE